MDVSSMCIGVLPVDVTTYQCCSRDLSETFPRPFRDLSTCLSLEIVRYINIPTTEAIESNDLNIENW